MKEAKLMKTKSGNGFKIFVDNEWIYAKDADVQRLVKGEIAVVTFRSLEVSPIPKLVEMS